MGKRFGPEELHETGVYWALERGDELWQPVRAGMIEGKMCIYQLNMEGPTVPEAFIVFEGPIHPPKK